MAEAPLTNLPFGGIRKTDVLFVETHDGTCSRCREEIAEDEVPLLLWPNPEETGGELMYAFCTRCAFDPDSKRCRVCGCTDLYGCDEGCEWVEHNLCSRCLRLNG